jgi:hypothetical protein
MGLGTIKASLAFEHVGFGHVQTAMQAGLHGAGLQSIHI